MSTEPTPGNAPSVVFTRTKLLPDAYGDVIRQFDRTVEGVNCVEAGDEPMMLDLVAKGGAGLFVFLISDSNELLELLNFLPKVRNTIREKRVAILVLSKVKSEKIEDVLKKSGCSEILCYDLSVKGIFFKIRRYVYNLKQLVQNEGEGGQGERMVIRSRNPLEDHLSDDAPREIVSRKQRISEQVELAEPLGISEDYWLLRRVSHIRRYRNQWHVEMIGPSPASGRWKLTPDYDLLFPEEESIWAWTMREKPGKYGPPFDVSPRCWIFTGKKPEYSWEVNRWSFLSGNPGLHLIDSGRVHATRFFENEEGMLEIHKNSAAAIRRFVEIQRSFDHGHFAELEGHVPAGADPAGVPRPPAPNMPWADRLNSNRIHPDAWNSQDLTRDEGPEWSNFGEDSDSMTVERVGEAAEEEGLPGVIDVPLGASAMRDCGIRAQVQGEDVDLVSYSEDQPVVIVGTLKEYELNSEISIEIRSDNLKRELDFDLSGVVSSIEKVADGQALLTVRLNMDSYQRISLIRDAITKRQEEIFKFFKQAKGS